MVQNQTVTSLTDPLCWIHNCRFGFGIKSVKLNSKYIFFPWIGAYKVFKATIKLVEPASG